MRKIKAMMVLLGTACVAGAIVYNVLLTEDARKRARECAESLNDAWAKIAEAAGMGTQNNDEAEILANQTETAAQWEALGY